MPPKKKSNEEVVEQEVEETEVMVVSDPYMAVQGSPVAPSKTYQAERNGIHISVVAPMSWCPALTTFLWDYGSVTQTRAGRDHDELRVPVHPIFPPDEVFQSVLSMLERMEKIYLAEKANQP